MRNLILLFGLLLLPCQALAVVTISVHPTSDTVLPGSERSVYSNIQGDANVGVTWSASGGTLVNSPGYTTWTAPSVAGDYLVTGTSSADPSKSATTTFTVISTAIVRVSNVPAQVTIFKAQPQIIQSVLWGNTNTAVKWSSSGGSLTGTGREVVFSADTAGTYTITSTSNADNTKKATTTVVVTNNPWPGRATANKTMPVDCTATGSGATYEVTNELEMDTVPWSTLGAGDTVRVHPGTYHKQILLSTSGTDSQPIRICGVSDSSGNLPILDGTNASAAKGSKYGTGLGNMQMFGGIMIYSWDGAHSGYYLGAVYPKNIVIEGLKITGFNRSNSYTDLSTGLVTAYHKGAAPIRAQHGGNITIRGNDLSSNGNGLFTMCKSMESGVTRNLLVEGNYFHNNGVANDYLEHQSYLQSFGLVVQGNHYDYPLVGMPGSQLKTRAVQQFIRYNYFEPAPRILDLVEVQDATNIVFPWVGVETAELRNTTPIDVVSNYEAYQHRFVYGNILHNSGSAITGAWWLHAAGDNTQSTNPGGTTYFYNNTIWSSIDAGSNWRSGLVDLGPYGDAYTSHSIWPSVRLTNNAIWLNGLATKLFFWNRYKADRVIIDKNWVTQGWGTGDIKGGDGTGIASASATNMWPGGQLNTQVSGIVNLVAGSSVPFDPVTFAPTNASPLIKASVALPGLSASLPPLMQYSPVTHLMTQRATLLDMGAVGTGAPSSVVKPASDLKGSWN